MKKLMIGLTVVLMVVSTSAFAALTPNAWKSTVTSGDWNNPDNWELGHVPTTSEMATFPEGSPSCTVNIDSDCSVGDFYAYASSGAVLTFTGSHSLTVTGSTLYFRREVVIDGPAINFTTSVLMTYASVTVSSGSLTCATYYRFSGAYSLTVDGGSVNCTSSFQYYTYIAGANALYVKSGSFTTPKIIGVDDATKGTHGRYSLTIGISGGVAEIANLDLTVGHALALTQTGGELRLSNGAIADGTTVSLTGGTVKFVGDVTYGPGSLYEIVREELGVRPDMSEAYLCAPEGGILADSEALTAKGIKSTDSVATYVNLESLTLSGGYPFSFASGASRTFNVYGPTVFLTTADMTYVEDAQNNVTVNIHGQVTIDTKDVDDPSSAHSMYLSGVASPDGSAELIVRGGGTFWLRPANCWNPLRGVVVEEDTTLALVDRSASGRTWGPLSTERLTLGARATLKIDANGSFVRLAACEIDPSARIVVTLPDAFAGSAAWPILQTTGETAIPAALASQVELVNAPQGAVVKCEAGQLTVSLRGDDLGKWSDVENDVYEWTGVGADAKWLTGSNWQGDVAPAQKKYIVFGSSSHADSNYDGLNGGGSTSCGFIFKDNAIESFNVFGTRQMTLSDSANAVCSYANVPQTIDINLRVTGSSMGLSARGVAPVVMGTKGFTFQKAAGILSLSGDVRVTEGTVSIPQIGFSSPDYPQSMTRLVVLNGATLTVTNQTSDISGNDTGFRVNAGGKLIVTGGSDARYRRTTSSLFQTVDGSMEINVPFVGGADQAFGGSGRLDISAGTRSGASNSRVLFANELNVHPVSWATATADGDGAVAIRVEGTPTLHVTDGWTYGPAAGVTPASEVAARALVVQGGATLTVEAGSGTVRFADPFVGDVMTARLPSTLAITNGTLALDGSFETDVSVKALAGGTLSVAANQTVGGLSAQGGTLAVSPDAVLAVEGDVDVSELEFADVGNAWRTYVTATGTITGLAARKSIKLRTVKLDDGVTALQVKNITGFGIIIR